LGAPPKKAPVEAVPEEDKEDEKDSESDSDSDSSSSSDSSDGEEGKDGSDSDSSSDSSESSDEADLQLDDDKKYFVAGDHGTLGANEYEIVVPARFAADSDDIFMRSMIQNYAVEGQNDDGAPNGNFFLTESGAKAAPREVLATHKGVTGAALDGYLDTYWAKSWGHFDVNRTGHVEAIKMPQLMRFLASDQYMSLQ